MEHAVERIAKKHGWITIDHQRNISLLSFRKGDTRVNVYYSKMTVSTSMNHPVKGRTQLFRRNMWNLQALEKIFANPRVHTGRGYYRK